MAVILKTLNLMLCFGLIDGRNNSSHNEKPVVTDWLDSHVFPAVSSLDL